MSAELNGINPSFTIRRNMQHALDDSILVNELRKVVVLLNGFIVMLLLCCIILCCLFRELLLETGRQEE